MNCKTLEAVHTHTHTHTCILNKIIRGKNTFISDA